LWRPIELWDVEAPTFSRHRLTDGGEVVSVTRQAIPVTGCGGLLGCDTRKSAHFLGNRLTDGGEAVSLTRQAIPVNRLWRPIELWDVEAPTFSRHRLTGGGEVVSVTRQAIPATGRGGPLGSETSSLPHFYKIGSQMSVRLAALRAGRPPFTPRKIPGTHFC
jgi:hypothetical protein